MIVAVVVAAGDVAVFVVAAVFVVVVVVVFVVIIIIRWGDVEGTCRGVSLREIHELVDAVHRHPAWMMINIILIK